MVTTCITLCLLVSATYHATLTLGMGGTMQIIHWPRACTYELRSLKNIKSTNVHRIGSLCQSMKLPLCEGIIGIIRLSSLTSIELIHGSHIERIFDTFDIPDLYLAVSGAGGGINVNFLIRAG